MEKVREIKSERGPSVGSDEGVLVGCWVGGEVSGCWVLGFGWGGGKP